MSKLLRRPLLLEIRDLWPESIAAVGAVRSERMLRLVERMEHFMYASAEHIVTVGEGYRQGLIERGVEPERVSIVMNGVDAEVFPPGGEGTRPLWIGWGSAVVTWSPTAVR